MRLAVTFFILAIVAAMFGFGETTPTQPCPEAPQQFWLSEPWLTVARVCFFVSVAAFIFRILFYSSKALTEYKP